MINDLHKLRHGSFAKNTCNDLERTYEGYSFEIFDKEGLFDVADPRGLLNVTQADFLPYINDPEFLGDINDPDFLHDLTRIYNEAHGLSEMDDTYEKTYYAFKIHYDILISLGELTKAVCAVE